MRTRELTLATVASLTCCASTTFAQVSSPLRACQSVQVTAAVTSETNAIPSNSLGCRSGGRINARSGQVFNCRGNENANGDILANKILIQPRGGPLHRVSIDDFSPSLSQMKLYDVNLGGDAQREHVLALWQAQQNGFGTNIWIISVFDASWRHLETYTDVEDFGPNNIVEGTGSCALALTKFERRATAGQNAPLFYEARFVGIVGERLIALPRTQSRQRRYTNQFERQRLATFDRQTGLAKEGDLVGWMNASR